MAEPPADDAPDIASLTARMTRGDEDAYRVFYARYQPRLLRYLLVVTRDETAARDALQRALLRVVRHIRRFEREDVFWSWLTVLARTAAADEGRSRRRYFAFLQRFLDHAAAPAAEPAGAARAARAARADDLLTTLLREEIAALPTDERALIEEKYLAGRSVEALAALFPATSEKAVESRLGRIRRKLKTAVLARLRHEPLS